MPRVPLYALLFHLIIALCLAKGQPIPSGQMYPLERNWNYTSPVSVATPWLGRVTAGEYPTAYAVGSYLTPLRGLRYVVATPESDSPEGTIDTEAASDICSLLLSRRRPRERIERPQAPKGRKNLAPAMSCNEYRDISISVIENRLLLIGYLISAGVHPGG